jgi:tRNA(fMet)-specific endonuclease VapC
MSIDTPRMRERLLKVPMHCVAVSVVTQAELKYGVAKRGHPQGLATRVREFLARVTVLAWTPEVAALKGGDTAMLITRDRAFWRVPGGLALDDWTQQELS